MKTFHLLSRVVLIFFAQACVFAITTIIPLGANVQNALNAAASGDTLVFEPGTYTDANLYFGKPYKILAGSESSAPAVTFTGTVKIEHGAASTSTFQGIAFGGSVLINEATASFIDVNFANSLGATQANLTLKRVFAQTINLTNTAVDALRLTAQGAVNAKSLAGPVSWLAVQSTFQGALTINNEKVSMGYCSLFQATLVGCESLFIGNIIKATFGGGSVITGGSGRFLNNACLNNGPVMTIDTGFVGEFVNNSFSGSSFAVNGPSGAVFKGNIFKGGVYVATAAANLVYFSYCNFPSTLAYAPPVVNTPLQSCTFSVDPKTSADLLTLAGDSPCINTGMPESIYNNRDGTRNTIGYTGGPYLNPANYTNNNPLVFFLSGPRVVPKSATTIPITATATAGH